MHVAQTAIMLTYGSALVIAIEKDGLDPTVFGAVLIAFNFSVLAAALLIAWLHSRMLDAKLKAKLSKHATAVEYAVGWSAEKYRTTLNAVEKNHVPASECLAYWYCSTAQAKLAVEIGIPACSVHGGIVFSVHRPYQLRESERAHFVNFSSVIVVGLPRALLRTLPSNPEMLLLPEKCIVCS